MIMERGLGMDGPLSSPNMEQGKKFLGSLFSEEGQEISLLGEGITIEGTLHFETGVVRLDGRWQGKIIGRGIELGRHERWDGVHYLCGPT